MDFVEGVLVGIVLAGIVWPLVRSWLEWRAGREAWRQASERRRQSRPNGDWTALQPYVSRPDPGPSASSTIGGLTDKPPKNNGNGSSSSAE